MRVILSLGRLPMKQARDAVVIDHLNFCFWYRDRAFLHPYRPRVQWKGQSYEGCGAAPRRIFKLGSAMLVRSPGLLSMKEMVEIIYGDDEDGGPDFPERVVYLMLFRLRELFSLMDLRISKDCGIGYWAEDIPTVEIAA